jgi:hypothetical protein
MLFVVVAIAAAVLMPVEVHARFHPGLQAHGPAHLTAPKISLGEMDSAIAPREAGLVGSGRKGRPMERDICRRNGARLDPRAARCDRHLIAEPIAAGEPLQDLRRGGAEGAVS